MPWEKMTLKTIEDLQERAAALHIRLPLSEDTGLLSRPLDVAGKTLANRFVIQPMEGCDSNEHSAPGELTVRRYHRFAGSGAALIWFEATAIVPEARANPRQAMLTEENVDAFKRLIDDMRAIAMKEHGINPMIIVQLTHSGRYSKPQGVPAPIAARHNPIYDRDRALDEACIVQDSCLDALPDQYARAVRLAHRAGFDGADIKACHGYLLCELLSAHTRAGRYGGSFENRTRLYLDAVRAAQAAAPAGFIVTSRLNAYDGLPYPWGFGTSAQAPQEDLAEPIALVKKLHSLGMPLINITIGNPYYNPHVNRPYDEGQYDAPEHPLQGVARICRITAALKAAVPGMALVSSGNSYLRGLSPYMAAGMLATNAADLVGFGREAFAYPDFARDIMADGAMNPRKTCIACGKCSELMRRTTAGCVVRDARVYAPIYQAMKAGG